MSSGWVKIQIPMRRITHKLDKDLEVVLRWHVFVYLCILLGCFGDVPQIRPSNGDSQDEDIEPKGNGALNMMIIHLLLHIYKQMKFWLDKHPRSKIELDIRLSDSNGK